MCVFVRRLFFACCDDLGLLQKEEEEGVGNCGRDMEGEEESFVVFVGELFRLS